MPIAATASSVTPRKIAAIGRRRRSVATFGPPAADTSSAAARHRSSGEPIAPKSETSAKNGSGTGRPGAVSTTGRRPRGRSRQPASGIRATGSVARAGSGRAPRRDGRRAVRAAVVELDRRRLRRPASLAGGSDARRRRRGADGRRHGRNELGLDLGDLGLQVAAPLGGDFGREIRISLQRALERGEGRPVDLFTKGAIVGIALLEGAADRLFDHIQSQILIKRRRRRWLALRKGRRNVIGPLI